MRNKRRNIPDPISPQNPLHQTDRTDDRIQEHLEDKTHVEDIFRDETDLIKDQERLNQKRYNTNASKTIDPDENTGL
jgi:hypothetical protein